MYRDDFSWAQRWIPALRRFIGPYLLRVGTLREDRHQATDLIVLDAEGIRIACRVRRPGYAKNAWAREITLTTRRESGASTEWDKMILGGWSDWFCYAHASADSPAMGGVLSPAFLLDLAPIRPYLVASAMAVPERPNGDPLGQRCFFRAFSVDQIMRACGRKAIIAERPR